MRKMVILRISLRKNVIHFPKKQKKTKKGKHLFLMTRRIFTQAVK